MINIKTVAMIAVGLAVTAATSQAALRMDFGSLQDMRFAGGPGNASAGGKFSFLGNSAQFGKTFAPGTDFYVGNFTTSPYSYGPVSIFDGGKTQTATVNDPGTVTIVRQDPNGTTTFTSSLKWNDITTFGFSGGTAGINTDVLANLYSPSINYIGIGTADVALMDLYGAALANPSAAALNVTFQPRKQLSNFPVGTWTPSSYSVTLEYTPVPEPSTYLAGLGALALFGFTAMPRRKQVK